MIQSRLTELIAHAISSLWPSEEIKFKVDVPPRPEMGDFAANTAILLGKKLSRNPLDIAKTLAEKISALDKEHLINRIEIARPGFVNIFIDDEFIRGQLPEIIKQDEKWGKGDQGKGKKVLLEFVSANPTGPLHVGHGRWAVIGDVIARLLSASGYRVDKEFYVNNIGNQVEKLWESVKAVREGREAPEGGYGGAYMKEVQGETKEKVIEYLLGEQKETLGKTGVKFDNYFFESNLHKENKVKWAVEKLDEIGKTFEEGGAIWFKSQELGDDKNRVLIREDGQPTYFAADIAYHMDKFARGYDQLINIWGTDHHGYIGRLKGALKVLGLPVEHFEIIIGQLVTLYRGNEPVRMSKRTGEMVTLQEVVDEIGADATRFFFSATDVNSHLDFDLELAKKQSSENPVYYVQYAHARICSILRKAGLATRDSRLESLDHPAERKLMLKLISFPDTVGIAAELRHPHRMTEYAKELATEFHHFYEKCRVLGNPARMLLVDASRITLRNVLELLGISAPETM